MEIEDELLAEAMKATGLPSTRTTVEEGLRLLLRVRKQADAVAKLDGLGREGDLGDMRGDRLPERR